MPTVFAAAEIDLDEMIDLDTFPVHDVDGSAQSDLIASAREEMKAATYSVGLPIYGRAAELHHKRANVVADGLVD